ncbi:putative C2 domain-containing protein [Rosa chinensis]|uniref:Putative C2 domain-containing protein n=1 Tax=Rosa chinensis TaxID=74649 RepID=A0A2P6RQP9_ROSCH|nr:uncharacterized protein LOC112189635 [Rosa chinensis]PRQ48769.1 putative C2 domain-containing protein [Rosa chinensis]
MGIPLELSSLSCGLRIIQAKNIEFIKTTGNLFVRYYLSAGDSKKIRLNTREISTKSDHIWDESISLECNGSDSFVRETVVFELRWRNTVPVFGRIGGSQLLGRAEVPWKEVLESPNMELDKWVTMVPRSTSGGAIEGVKPPKLQVSIKVGVQAEVGMEKRRLRRTKKWDECGCEDGHGHGHGYGCTCSDYEIFALAALLEAL